jgi:AraC-like DNA-binding protein
MRTIANAGLKRQPPGYRFATSNYDLLQAIVVQNGELVVKLEDGSTRRAIRGMALLLRPGSRFMLSCPRRGYDGVFVVVPASKEQTGPSHLFPAGRTLAVVAIEMRNAIESGAAAHPGLLHAFAALLLRLVENAEAPVSPSGDSWADRVGHLLDSHLYSSTPVAEILRGLPLGARQIHRHFQAATGKGVKRHLLERKIMEAKKLIANPALKITAIAMDLGFPSSQHFATQFRAIVGMTPSAWRIQGRLSTYSKS